MLRDHIVALSNHRLEAELSAFYWAQARETRMAGLPAGSFPQLREENLLGALWEEFDRRVEAGLI